MIRSLSTLLAVGALFLVPSAASAAGLTQPLRATSAAPNAGAVGLLPDGTAGLATSQNVGGVQHVFAQVRPPGGTWSTPQDLGATGSITNPPVIAAAGNSLVLAYDKNTGNDQVALATLGSSAAAWSDLGAIGIGTLPRLAGAADGSFVLVYRDAVGNLIVYRATSSTALGAPESVATGVQSLDVGRRSNGQLVTVWSDSATAGNTVTIKVKTATSSTGAAFGAPVELATDSYTTDAVPASSKAFVDPRVALTAQDATFAWGRRTSSIITSGRTETRRMSLAGVLDATQTQGTDGPPSGLALLADDAGVLTLAFTSGNLGASQLHASIRPAGQTAFPTTPAPAVAGNEDGQFVSSPSLAVSGQEAAIAYGYSGSGRSHVLRRVGTELQPDAPLEASSGGSPAIAGDGSGQFAVAYPRSDAGSVGAWSRFYDRTPPVLTPASAAPSGALIGAPFAFTTTATDALSSAPGVTWAFGDGGTGTGAAVSHAYAAAGQPTAVARAVDEAGNEATSSVQVTVGAPAPVVPPVVVKPPTVKPAKVKVSGLKLTKTGVRLKLSGAAKVTIAIQKRSCRTVKRKRRCRYAKAKRVTKTLAKGTRTVQVKLRKGTYRITVSAKTAAGTSKTVKVLKR